MNLLNTPDQLVSQSKSVENVLNGANFKMMNIQLKAGEEVAEHDSEKEVVIIVRRGSVLFTVEGEPVTVTTGNVLHMTPFEKHSLRAQTDTDICVMQITP